MYCFCDKKKKTHSIKAELQRRVERRQFLILISFLLEERAVVLAHCAV